MMQGVASTPKGIFALDYDNARWYDPQSEDFISQDPKGFAAGDPNLYRLGDNDPVNNTDPTGMDTGQILPPIASDVSPVPWSRPISPVNFAPQANNFSTGQTPLWTVPGTSYVPAEQKIAQASAASSALAAQEAQSQAGIQQEIQQLGEPSQQELAANAQAAQQSMQAFSQAWDQLMAQATAAGQAQAEAENSQPEQFSLPEWEESDVWASISAGQEAQAYWAGYDPNNLIESYLGAMLLPEQAGGWAQNDTFLNIYHSVATTVQISGLIAAPVFGFAGSIAAAGDADILGMNLADADFPGGASAPLTRPFYPEGSNPTPGLTQMQFDEFNPIIEQAYMKNPGGSELMAAMGNAVENGGSSFAASTQAEYDQLVADARIKYPNSPAGTQNHHITPQYLGGPANGPTVPIDAAYHQQITQAFKRAYPYSQPEPDPATLRRIMQDVYKQYPLPPGTK
jgi:hypothetical protein